MGTEYTGAVRQACQADYKPDHPFTPGRGAPRFGKERIFAQRCTVGDSGFLPAADAGKGQGLFPKHWGRPGRQQQPRRRAADGKYFAG